VLDYVEVDLYGHQNEDYMSYPGDICVDSVNCYGDAKCFDGVCVTEFQDLGVKCRTNGDCTPGQFCDSTKCRLTH
jgi:hypothetical protein